MTLLNSWMPTYDVSARYTIRIDAPPTDVYATLVSTDFGRPLVVRALMAIRLLPGLLRSPGTTWKRLRRAGPTSRASLTDLDRSDFVLLERQPPREIVLGITGRFWSLSAATIRVPPASFRDPLPAGFAQAAWSFEVTGTADGSELATETRVRTADPETRRQFRRYWRVVSPGSGLIRHAILSQVRREAIASVR
jgi:hypothetical protein